MSNLQGLRRWQGLFLAALFIFISLSLYSSGGNRVMVTEKFTDRIRVLYLAERGPHHNYLQIDFLERNTDLRFIYQRNSSPETGRNDESAAIADGILWDGAASPLISSERISELNDILKERHFDFVILELKEFAPETASLIAEYVKGGGYLIWLGSSVVEEGPLAEICPFKKSDVKPSRKEKITVVKGNHPLFAGMPLETMFEGRVPQGSFKGAVEVAVSTSPTGQGLLGIMEVGKGTVLALNLSGIVQPNHTSKADTDFLWAHLWQQAGTYWKGRGCGLSSYLSIDTLDEDIPSGGQVPVSVNISHKSGEHPYYMLLEITDRQGKNHIKKEFLLSAGDVPKNVSLILPEDMKTGIYLLTSKITDRRRNVIHSAYSYISVKGMVEVTLKTDSYGYAAGQPVLITADIKSKKDVPLVAKLVIKDSMNIPVMYEKKDVRVPAGEGREITFDWMMPDYGVEGWAFCADIIVEDGSKRVVGTAKDWFWRYEKWTMREKFLFCNYYAGEGRIPASMMPLFALYHRGVGFNAGHSWHEPYYSRFNMRGWLQYPTTLLENFTGNFRTPDFSHLAERGKREFESSRHTAAWVIYDFGEESGYYYHWSNNPFERKWKDAKDIPEGAHTLFRLYLKGRYGTIEDLNRQWQRSFGSFEDIKMERRYGLPAGWLFGPPPESVEDNLAPYIDTHGFFFWYNQQVAEGLTRAINRYNPTADWGMSFSLTFNPFPPIPMTMIHPFYSAQLLSAWHARGTVNSRNESTPIFSFHWGFDEDYRSWAQFWHQNLAALATYQSNWGSMFNFNLTHSRSTLLFKRYMSRVRPRERFFLDCYPVEDYDVGIYHPTLDWAQVHSRPNFFLKSKGPNDPAMGQLGYKSTGTGWLGGPEHQIYSLLNSSGYLPRFVKEEDIKKCRVLFVPYVETLPEGAVEEMKRFVSAGGLLVTMPVTGTHNGYGKPYNVVPGGGLAEVLGLTLGRDIIGQRSLIVLPSLSGDEHPLQFSYTPRQGSEPPYLWTFGHQQVKTIDKGVGVVARLYDGSPAITVNSYGKGMAVHLNLFTFDHFSQYEFSHFNNESLRQLLDNLVKDAGVKPYVFVERPWLYGTGINEWVHYQYQLKESDIRVLALYSDKMSPHIIGQAVISEPVCEVFDILDGTPVPLRFRLGGDTVTDMDPFSFEEAKKSGLTTGLTFPVEMDAGDVRFYALVPYHTGPVEIKLQDRVIHSGKELLLMDVTVKKADGSVVEGAHPVHIDVLGPDGVVMPMLSRKMTVKGKATVKIPVRIGDPPGVWKIRVRDCVTGREDTGEVNVKSASPVSAIPETEDIFTPSTLSMDKIDISDSEFISLLESLRELYLTGGGRDKGSLSYYAMDRDGSRNRIMQMLNQADWMEKLPALKRYLREGNMVILLGEDIGYDPEGGLWLDPVSGKGYDGSIDMSTASDVKALPGNNKIAALEKLTGKKVKEEFFENKRVIDAAVGRGRIIIDPLSFDNMGQANGLFDLNHYNWRKSLIRRSDLRKVDREGKVW